MNAACFLEDAVNRNKNATGSRGIPQEPVASSHAIDVNYCYYPAPEAGREWCAVDQSHH